MKIKVKVYTTKYNCMPHLIKKGDWIDLTNAESVKIAKGTEVTKISLGVAMQLPKGFEAVVLPRSSTYSKYKITVVNSMGVIDNSYCGKDDIWKLPVIAQKDTFIPEGVRIAQFRIQLSQKATVWQKLRWLFSSGVKLIQVTNLGNTSRGGFGSTGDANYVEKSVKEKRGE